MTAQHAAAQQPNGIHHLAFMAGDIKKHIAFFSQVMGCPLVAIFDMHGVPGSLHAFLRMNDHAYFSIVQMPGVGDIPVQLGVTHAGRGEMPSAAGTLQHLAFNVDSEADLVAMRDRIRSHGVPVMGPIDHGMCKSIYFAGPDHLALEVATSSAAIDATRWIDPAVLEKVGITAAEVAAYKAPAPFVGQSPVAQPSYDPSKPHLTYPDQIYQKMLQVPDEVVSARASFAAPPVDG
ncbi:MAG: VOC family protein [Alphaproteobacteria bacterium]|nr:VOC family protein [Alphaproteobacteria bacterium]